ncbi:L-aspartate oxidase [Haliovirga abyssi]|uniref:L-aspartate oxidase n=1 Tax=Haliovirga abyssi TaxID=2996794 RepID=A0AAU9DHJ2_9FUSO|nr:L-aspartate oxidase [Haliovirga abyssi]BDU51007.1 L-aspartate oxidase [Haliovirga abyssi]
MRIIDELNPINFVDIEKIEVEKKEFIVIGTGISGLRAALEISKKSKVTLITKSEMIETNTNYAQGGVAVVFSEDDTFELHKQDTLYAGAGLCIEKAVDVLVEEGPLRVKELININTNFDKNDKGEINLTREAAHSKFRILHAGDTTGAEIERALTEEVKKQKNIEILEYNFLLDIIDKNSCLVHDIKKDEMKLFSFKGIIFATGSIGKVYKNTSNPDVATGDGLAIAYRNKVELSDIEFVQFHPTTFYKKGAPRFLISESLRGEGGILRNINGERFMAKYDSKKELAPRDVVSRSILTEMEKTNSECVYLDMTNLDKDYLYKRFPRITEFCMEYNIDIAKDYIPVSPAAHYIMGGISTDINGKTNKKEIYAVGEAARTGVHGANRLASNSLLEGLVFGKRAGEIALKEREKIKIEMKGIKFNINSKKEISSEEIEKIKENIEELMWEKVGIRREEKSLKDSLNEIGNIVEYIKQYKFKREDVVKGIELLNILTVAYLITEAALNRKESRGGHYRIDYPETLESERKHSVIIKD